MIHAILAAAIAIPSVSGVPTLYHRAVPPATGPVDAVLLGPLFDRPFVCVDHPEGDVGALGDAFGTDCMAIGGADAKGGYFRLFRNDGSKNEDWYGWHASVLAPFDGSVMGVHENPVTNVPGTMAQAMASDIVFKRPDGLVVVFAHVTGIRVKAGDHVAAGQIVAIDGNNGMARAPHVHVGAFRDMTPYQIRWDQRAEGKLFKDG